MTIESFHVEAIDAKKIQNNILDNFRHTVENSMELDNIISNNVYTLVNPVVLIIIVKSKNKNNNN